MAVDPKNPGVCRAALSSFNLRVFLEYLADETNAEKIHLIGYSAGTRVVINALVQAALIHYNDDKSTTQRRRKVGRVVIVGSDFGRGLYGAYLVEGLLKVPESITIYSSGTEKHWVYPGGYSAANGLVKRCRTVCVQP